MFKVGDRVWFNHNKEYVKVVATLPNNNNIICRLENGKHYPILDEDLHQTADDMFESLGYELKLKSSMYIIYEHHNSENGITTVVTLDISREAYKVSNHTRNNRIYSALINKKLHQAIHQQMIELGWL